jgi:S-adenosylmethionine:tRNA ribosyltransferase-isomerase
VNDYDLSYYEYSLPEELIAQYPKDKRDESRLLIMDRKSGALKEDVFCNIGNYLDAGDLLVVNDTRVFPARLYGHKDDRGSAKVEVLLLKQLTENCWEALVRPEKSFCRMFVLYLMAVS